MKKFFIGILIASIILPIPAHAQIACTTITRSNYSQCCGVLAGNTNEDACNTYRSNTTQPTVSDPVVPDAPTTTTTVHSTPVPGAIGSGTSPTSAPINNTSTATNGELFATPQTGSTELQQCSKIKFISLLDILIWLKCIIAVAVIPLIFTAAFGFFLWGVMKFIAASDAAKKQEGKKFIAAGLIGLFVMTAVWGIIRIIGNTLGTGSAVPVLQTSSLQKK